MSFRDAEIENFLQLFNERKALIRNFTGCRHLELWQDACLPCTFFTYSIWDNEAALENYRLSDFFADTWQQTKILFAGKPHAWTVAVRSA